MASPRSLKELFRSECVFMRAMRSEADFFKGYLPEFAFIGRSNVGKSSLINVLVKRKSLARVGKTPGCTKQINVFKIGESFFLMDMPGYGYAKASKQEAERWLHVSLSYFESSPHLKRVFILVDSRHGLKESDKDMMSWLDVEGVAYTIVLTKSDKVGVKALEKNKEDITTILQTHPAAHNDVLVTSSEKGKGIDSLQAHIRDLL